MENLLPTTLLFLACLFACKNDSPTHQKEPETDSFSISSNTIELKEGDCADAPFESKCAKVSLKYPVVKDGQTNLQQNVNNWAKDFLVSLLDPGLELDEETSLESAIQGFFDMHKEMTAEMPDMPGYYTVEVTDTTLMQSDELLTLRMDAYSNTGGAHPNSTAAIATFDMKTGKHLRPVDLVQDLEKLYALAEQKFRETQKEAFEEGFDFTESWPFVIAENVGMTTEGLFFCYVPYEVTPYALGFTEFVIPYDELEKL